MAVLDGSFGETRSIWKDISDGSHTNIIMIFKEGGIWIIVSDVVDSCPAQRFPNHLCPTVEGGLELSIPLFHNKTIKPRNEILKKKKRKNIQTF